MGWQFLTRSVTLTFKPIWIFINFLTSIPSLIFTKLPAVSMEHLERVRHQQGTLSRLDTWCSPFIATCLCSNCWDYFSRVNACHFYYTAFCGYWEDLHPVNKYNQTSLVAIVTATDRPKSVRNRCVIKVFGCVFVLPRCFLNFSVGVGAFVIGLSQISSFFSCNVVSRFFTLNILGTFSILLASQLAIMTKSSSWENVLTSCLIVENNNNVIGSGSYRICY